jgi:hypothetical protein
MLKPGNPGQLLSNLSRNPVVMTGPVDLTAETRPEYQPPSSARITKTRWLSFLRHAAFCTESLNLASVLET